jgi:hypothetical protein
MVYKFQKKIFLGSFDSDDRADGSKDLVKNTWASIKFQVIENIHKLIQFISIFQKAGR